MRGPGGANGWDSEKILKNKKTTNIEVLRDCSAITMVCKCGRSVTVTIVKDNP